MAANFIRRDYIRPCAVGSAVIYSVALLSLPRRSRIHIAWTRCMRAVPYVPYGEERGKSFLVNRAQVLSLL